LLTLLITRKMHYVKTCIRTSSSSSSTPHSQDVPFRTPPHPKKLASPPPRHSENTKKLASPHPQDTQNIPSSPTPSPENTEKLASPDPQETPNITSPPPHPPPPPSPPHEATKPTPPNGSAQNNHAKAGTSGPNTSVIGPGETPLLPVN
jgi:hypothetical protein